MKNLLLTIILMLSFNITLAGKPTDGPPGQDESFCDEHPNHPLCGDTPTPITDIIPYLIIGAIVIGYYTIKHEEICGKNIK